MTAEDRIHLALVLALAGATLAIHWRGPATAPLSSAEAARAAANAAPSEVHAAELEPAIERLEAWLARSRARAPAGAPYAAELQGLGPAPEDRAHPERWLARLWGSDVVNTWLTPPAGAVHDGSGEELTSALVVLLEAGVPLAQPLSSEPSEKAPRVTLSELVRRSLDRPADTPSDEAERSPERLDLLSLAVLGGLTDYRERLASATARSLFQLDRAQRTQDTQPGAGTLDALQLEQLAVARRAELEREHGGAVDLHWSAAAFRGAAVLGEVDLEAQARRHLNALLSRYHADRTFYLYLEARARDARERRLVQLAALEHLGRFEEALYNAHLIFRSDSHAAPSPATAQVMRFAARDLIERLQRLDAQEFELQGPGAEQTPGALLRAAVHALRGLRTARVAG